MSFIEQKKGKMYTPGWFLVNNENVTRLTRKVSQSGSKTADNGGKYVPMGTIYPTNDKYAEGIVYEDVDVTTGDMPGSVVTAGTVYKDRLPVEITQDAETALATKGFVFINNSPTVTRT